MIIGLWIGEGGGQPLWDRRGGDLTGYGKDSNNRLIGLVYLVGGAQHHCIPGNPKAQCSRKLTYITQWVHTLSTSRWLGISLLVHI